MSDDTALRLLADAFLAEHPDDAGRRLERLEPREGARLLDELSPDEAGGIIRTMSPQPAALYIAAMRPETAAGAIESLPVDLAARILRRIEPDERARLLGDVSDEAARSIRALAEYPEDSVAAHTETRDWAAPADWTVSDVRKRLREAPEPHIYVVNRAHEVVGVVHADSLRDTPGQRRVLDIARRDVIKLRAEAKIATVQSHPAWLDVDTLPVVDGAGRLVGLLRHQAVRRATAGTSTGTPANAVIQTIVGLGELYWTGMTTVLTGISPRKTAQREAPDEHSGK